MCVVVYINKPATRTVQREDHQIYRRLGKVEVVKREQPKLTHTDEFTTERI